MANTLRVADVLIRWRQEGVKEATVATKQLESAQHSLGKTLAATGESFRKAGLVMTAGLTAPLALIGKQAIDAASDLNEATSAVQVTFGKASNEMIRFSQTAAQRLGLSQRAALSASTQFAGLAKAAGLTGAATVDFSKKLLEASADLGSFFNQDPSEVLNALRSGLIGESEPLRRFNILISDAAVKQKALALGLADTEDAVTDAMKVQARYQLILEQLGPAVGDFGRTSDGLANSSRILAAELENVRAEIGTYLLPYALELTNRLKDLLGWFRGLSEDGKRLAVTIGAIAAAAGPALLIFGQTLSVVAKIGPAMALLTGPLGLVVAGIAGLALAWQQNWFGMRDIVQNVVDTVGPIFERMIQFFQAAGDRGIDPFRRALRTLIVPLKEHFGRDHPLVDFLREVLHLGGRLGEAFKRGDWSAIFAELDKQSGRLATWVMEQIGKAVGFGARFVQKLAESFEGVNWDLVGARLNEGGLRLDIWLDDQYAKTRPFGEKLRKEFDASMAKVDWTTVFDTAGGELAKAAEGFNAHLNSTYANALAFGATLRQNIGKSLEGVNWDSLFDTLGATAREIFNHFVGGLGLGWQDVQNWIVGGARAGGGTQQGIGDRLWSLVLGQFAKAKGKLIETGKAPFEWLLQGMQEQWKAIETWLAGRPTLDFLSPLSGGGAGPGTGGSSGGNRRITNGALGGIAGGFTWVGEAGPELVHLPAGAMVTPTGASMAKFRGMFPGMAMGGRRAEDGTRVPGGFYAGGGGGGNAAWRAFLQSLTNRQRQLIQGVRQAGDLSAAVRAGLMAGTWTIAEDGSLIGPGYYGSGSGGGRERGRAAREPRVRTGGRNRDDEIDTGRDRGRRASDSLEMGTRIRGGGTEADPTRGGRFMTYAAYRDYRKHVARENRDNEIPPMNFYGPVNVYPATADVGMEIANYMLGAAR